MPARTIAIGDIHGCRAALDALLAEIAPTRADTIIVLGDMIDRGPESKQVIDRLLKLRGETNLVTLLGNHEAMLLAVRGGSLDLASWLPVGGTATLASYGGAIEGISPDHWDFYNSLRLYYESQHHFFVHANYARDLDFEDQPTYLILWEHLYQAPGRHKSRKTAIVGHTPQKGGEILDLDHVVCIDTACFAGGWLTALDVNSRRVWQADRDGKLRQ